MISTKSAITLDDVPNTWVFEHYLNLTEKLDGQQIKIYSVFKTEKTPSMIIYIDLATMNYKFKDFSSGLQGDSIELVENLFNLNSRVLAIYKIIDDYKEYMRYNKSYTQTEIKSYDNYKVTDYTIRHWSNFDQTYWSQYHIGSKMLEAYNVSPLEYYKMSRNEPDGSVSEITITGLNLYGYFKNDGTLYKIYQPKNMKKKFLKLSNYIQGSQQLTLTQDYLIITSSLKDVMAFNKLGFKNIECIAPDSENTMIKESSINKLKEKYKSICVLFDNDEAGINSMQKYKERYGLNYIILNMEKDISDSIKVHGIQKVKEVLFPLLKKQYMKGKITIEFKYDKENSNEFAQEITMKKVTILHIASAISKLTALMDQYATAEDKIRLAEAVRQEFDEVTTHMVVKPQGEA